MKFLIDEDLSPSIARYLCRNLLIDAVAARDRGLLGMTDAQILQYAFDEDRILITANICDFEIFVRNCEIHAGVVFIRNGSLLRDEQIVVVEKAINAIIRELESGQDMINRVLYVEMDNTMIFEILPSVLDSQ
jgi:predicted nuclease of predicted toxin-antitoxin system